MKRALILCGSANPDGVTARMCQASGRCLHDLGYSCEIIQPIDGIAHCSDCGSCTDGCCIVRDGMDEIYRKFSEADLLVMATPIHFSGPSSVIKTVMDRFQPYWFVKDMPHPRKVIGLMCGGSDEPEFRHTVSIFRAFSIMTGMEWVGHLEIKGTDRTHGEGVSDDVQSFLEGIIRDAERSCS